MKPNRFITHVVAAALLLGCSHEERDPHDQKAQGQGHGHEERRSSGASFKPGKGVILTDETRKILGVEVVDVAEEKLPQQVRFNVQIFGEKHQLHLDQEDHTGCDVHGSGFLPGDKALVVRSGQAAKLLTKANETFEGVVLGVKKALSVGEAEAVIGMTNAATKIKPGDFLTAIITLPGGGAVMVVPKSSLLRTSEGTFVYAVNGDAFMRTAVKVGTEGDELLEISDGLLTGDQVVTKPVETLWLIELRATKGGGHSH